jgi:hypothetical protein
VNYDWYALVNGGEHPAYVLAFPMRGFADLAPLAYLPAPAAK